MIFWGYLIRAIRNSNYACAVTPRTWPNSPGFKVWLAVSGVSGALLWGAVNIETENVDMMRVSLVSCLLALGIGFDFYLGFES